MRILMAQICHLLCYFSHARYLLRNSLCPLYSAKQELKPTLRIYPHLLGHLLDQSHHHQYPLPHP